METSRFTRHAFICVSDSACNLDGPAKEIHAELKRRKVAEGRKEDLRVNKSGCLGQCGHGPMMVVYPEGTWYSHLTVDDAIRIWNQHIVGGKPVEELAYRTAEGGTNVVPFRSLTDRRPDNQSPLWSPCSRCPL